jgi:cytochrome P450
VTATAVQEDLREQVLRLFAQDRALIQDPYPLFERIVAESPVLPLEPRKYLVANHALAKAVLRDADTFMQAPTRSRDLASTYSLLSDDEMLLLREVWDMEAGMLTRKMGEDHRRVRSAGNRALTPKRVAQLAVAIESITNELLDEAAALGDVVDLMPFCSSLPLLVIAELMDAPRSDLDKFRRWGEMHVAIVTTPLPPQIVRDVHAGYSEYREYVLDLAEQHRRNPRQTTLIAALLDASAADQLTLAELTAMYMLLLFAGHETTTNLIGNGLYAALRNPRQWELMKEDPSVVPTAVEEFLRFDPPVQMGGHKVVARDLEVAGFEFGAGDEILMCNAGSNRDPAAFERPGELDVTRSPNDHLAFGYGAHFCLGAPIARLEGRIAFETLIRRFPDLELASGEPLVYRPYFSHRGLTSLPVRLGRDRG